VLGLFCCEVEECPNSGVVATQRGTNVIKHERQDEFLDKPECIEIAVSSNLIENQPLPGRKEGERLDPGQRFGQKRPGEVEAFGASYQVFDLPVDLFRRLERGVEAVVGSVVDLFFRGCDYSLHFPAPLFVVSCLYSFSLTKLRSTMSVGKTVERSVENGGEFGEIGSKRFETALLLGQSKVLPL
jgi:hypothetical protein